MRFLKKIFYGWNLKKKFFISLSYKDTELFEHNKCFLPEWVDSYIFPAKEITPNEMISHDLINSIRRLDGLIYLGSEKSSRSSWVPLERDYALRLKKTVYLFDPTKNLFQKDNTKPLDLNIYASYHRNDEVTVSEIKNLLLQRNFNINLDDYNAPPSPDLSAELPNKIKRTLEKGGYTVLFLSNSSTRSKWVQEELKITARENKDRVLMCNINNPTKLNESFYESNIIDLYDSACKDGINRNKLDFLIVQLYWLIYQNTRAREN